MNISCYIPNISICKGQLAVYVDWNPPLDCHVPIFHDFWHWGRIFNLKDLDVMNCLKAVKIEDEIIVPPYTVELLFPWQLLCEILLKYFLFNPLSPRSFSIGPLICICQIGNLLEQIIAIFLVKKHLVTMLKQEWNHKKYLLKQPLD